ncbi:ABC transporter ATP-binding protein [Paraburkholderia sp. Ac-20336]|nr:ABC transporter ATP-binding protein [Paraburkholderia sp. Ac-20336]MBN3846157.1 ABC transporter ATP-binding protein [Paraburkholderia sp. Ac-20342]NIF55400.1 ABC transporter ATP-binding protein [Burkholderia sp. Ax-1724]NIF77837.1 ABC transporter ATP-binding protein [Paraburkholderia sp. Cy-641]
MSNASLVSIRDVSFKHASLPADSPDILRDLSLSLVRGEFMCILGPSGCGKTTVLNLIAGFESPTAGSIHMDGRPIDGPGVERGVVFQGDDSLYHWLTAQANVEFGLRVSGMKKTERAAKARQYLALVGLRGQEHKYPAELSGGMKQRVNVARVLACESKVLLMDEPFGQLDAQTRIVLQDELATIWQKTQRTVFFVTHDIAEAITLADRIVVLKRGPRSNVKEIVNCDLDRPRDRSNPRFGELYSRISSLIADEVLGVQTDRVTS